MKRKLVTLLLTMGMIVTLTACKAGTQENSDTVNKQVKEDKETQITEAVKESLPTQKELDSLFSKTMWWYRIRRELYFHDESKKAVESLTPEEATYMAVMSVCEDLWDKELEHTEDYYDIFPKNTVKEKEKELFGKVYDNVDWSFFEDKNIKKNDNGDILFPQGDWGLDSPRYEIYEISDESAEDETFQVMVNYYTRLEEDWEYEKELPSQDFVVKYDISKEEDGTYHIKNMASRDVGVKYYTSISDIPSEWFDKMKEHIKFVTSEDDKQSSERTYNQVHYGDAEYVGSMLVQSNDDKRTHLIALYKGTCGLDFTDEKEGWEDSFIFYKSYIYEDLGINDYEKSVGNLYPYEWSDNSFQRCCVDPDNGDFGWYEFDGYTDYEAWSADVDEYLKNKNMTMIDTDITTPPTEKTDDIEEELNQGMDESAEIQDSSARYSDEELCKMAQQYYYNKTGFEPPISEVDHEEGNGVISIHLYEIMDAGTEYEHWATSDWYRIDRVTAKGVDSMGDEIDLTEVSE